VSCSCSPGKSTDWPYPASPGRACDSYRVTDPLLNLLLPFWQMVIGVCVLAAVVVVGFRLAQRGPSRMTTALLVTGTAVALVCTISFLF
jgi:hypothetical protein